MCWQMSRLNELRAANYDILRRGACGATHRAYTLHTSTERDELFPRSSRSGHVKSKSMRRQAV